MNRRRNETALLPRAANYTTWAKESGKLIFENPSTFRQVVYDLNGGYFRVLQPFEPGGVTGKFLNLLGREVAPARRLANGTIGNPLLQSVGKGLYQVETHFRAL